MARNRQALDECRVFCTNVWIREPHEHHSTCSLACLTAGWLGGWLACLLACLLACWLAGLPACWLACLLPGWLARLLACLLACWLVGSRACLMAWVGLGKAATRRAATNTQSHRKAYKHFLRAHTRALLAAQVAQVGLHRGLLLVSSV